MIAIVRKELQENFKWAVICLLVIGAAQAYSLHDMSLDLGTYPENPVRVLQTLITCTLLGGFLAAMQILPEVRPDHWAYLVHRPLERATIFWGKAVAGITFYLACTVPPYLIACWWLSRPQRIAMPWDARYMLAGVTDILGGMLVYSAVLLTARRPARWYGSRMLPLVTALGAWLMASSLDEFWQAAAGILVSTGIFVVAARGAFMTAGEYRTQPQAARCCTALILFASCTGLLLFVVAIIANTIQILTGAPSAPPDEWRLWPARGLVRQVSKKNEPLRLFDRDGREIPAGEFSQAQKKNIQLQQPTTAARDWNSGRTHHASLYRYYMPLTTGQTTALAAYFSIDEHVFHLYARNGHSFKGYVGRDGFVPADAGNQRAAPFAGMLSNTFEFDQVRTLRFPHHAYWFEPDKHVLREIVATGPDDQIRGVSSLARNGVYAMADSPENLLLVVTDKQIIVTTTKGERRLTAPRRQLGPEYRSVDVFYAGGALNLYVRYQSIGLTPAQLKNPPPRQVDEIAPDGRVIKSYALPTVSIEHDMSDMIFRAVEVSTPPIVLAALAIYNYATQPSGGPLPQRDEDGSSTITLIAMSVLATIAAVAGKGVARRAGCDRRRQWVWAVAMLLLGPAGVLTMLCLFDWPAREACAGCGKQRTVVHQNCEQCGATWPALPPDGTELFESVANEAVTA